jgi:hypothetical protein
MPGNSIILSKLTYRYNRRIVLQYWDIAQLQLQRRRENYQRNLEPVDYQWTALVSICRRPGCPPHHTRLRTFDFICGNTPLSLVSTRTGESIVSVSFASPGFRRFLPNSQILLFDWWIDC